MESLRESYELTESLRVAAGSLICASMASFNFCPKILFMSDTTLSRHHVGKVLFVRVLCDPCVLKGSAADKRERNWWHEGHERFDTPMTCPKPCKMRYIR